VIANGRARHFMTRREKMNGEPNAAVQSQHLYEIADKGPPKSALFQLKNNISCCCCCCSCCCVAAYLLQTCELCLGRGYRWPLCLTARSPPGPPPFTLNFLAFALLPDPLPFAVRQPASPSWRSNLRNRLRIPRIHHLAYIPRINH